jgi:hypothetical protein
MASASFEKCLKTTAACIVACERCATECSAAGDRAREKCAAIARDCADICRLAEALMVRGSAFAGLACALCEKSCNACAAECAKFPKDACCKACLEACRACAVECKGCAA